MEKRYNERHASHYEDMPKELINMCLECKRVRCTGNCRPYEEKEREINKNSAMVRANGVYKKRGVAAEKYPFRGERISAAEMAERLDIHPATVRRHLKNGLTMEDIYRLHVFKNGS